MNSDSALWVDAEWSQIEAMLGGASEIDAAAVSSGALVRRREVRNGSQLLRLALGYATTGRSLRSTAAWSEAALSVGLSDVAVMKRLREAGDFLEVLVGRLLSASSVEVVALPQWEGAPIRLVDSSMFSGRGRKAAQHRLHATYDPIVGRFTVLDLTDTSVGETFRRAGVERGAIALGDRNYAKTKDVRALVENEAFFVVRAGINSMRLLDPKTQARITAQDVLSLLGEGQITERHVVLCEAKPKKGQTPPRPLEARLIILRATEAQAKYERARIKRSRTKQGVIPRQDTKALAGVVMFVTNLDPQTWQSDRVAQLYRLRWQIELAFKTLKSTFAMRSPPSKEPRLTRSWILANLAAALLADLLARRFERALPPSTDKCPA